MLCLPIASEVIGKLLLPLLAIMIKKVQKGHWVYRACVYVHVCVQNTNALVIADHCCSPCSYSTQKEDEVKESDSAAAISRLVSQESSRRIDLLRHTISIMLSFSMPMKVSGLDIYVSQTFITVISWIKNTPVTYVKTISQGVIFSQVSEHMNIVFEYETVGSSADLVKITHFNLFGRHFYGSDMSTYLSR